MTTEPPVGGGYPPPQPQGGPARGMPPLPDPPPGRRGDVPLPEPPAGPAPALQWGDPTPAPAPRPRPGPPLPVSRLAAATVALGVLVGGAGLALVLGIVTLLRLPRTGKRGKGLATTGIVLTFAWAAAIAVLYVAVLSKPPLRDAGGAIARKGEIAVTQLRAGDCLENFAASTEIGKITVVPCATAHNAEVFHTFELAGKDYPGDGPVREQASSQCLDTAKTAVKAADLANAKVAVFKPIAASWKRGEHGVACVTVQNSGTISRSIRS